MKPRRKYGIFERKLGTRRWKRVHPGISASRQVMARTYQSWLLAGYFSPRIERAVRPIIVISKPLNIVIKKKEI